MVRSEKSGAGGFIVAVMHEADGPVEACLKEALAGVSTEARTVSGYLPGVGVTDLVMSFIWMLVTAANFSGAVCGRVYLFGFPWSRIFSWSGLIPIASVYYLNYWFSAIWTKLIQLKDCRGERAGKRGMSKALPAVRT